MTACIGLFGLASYSAEQRSKELSIRKVLGASSTELVRVFSGEFLRLVFWAFMLAGPLAYHLVDMWLSEFPYRTPISISLFFTVGFLVALLAFSTISVQSLITAKRNPAGTLKDD